MMLTADEFMRRFLLHDAAKGFRRIRHYGFLANACRAIKLASIRAGPQAAEPIDYRERYAALTGNRSMCVLAARTHDRYHSMVTGAGPAHHAAILR